MSAPVITSPLVATGIVGVPFVYTITADNDPDSFDASNTPAWMSVDEETGTLSGTPDEAGAFVVTVGAENADGIDTADVEITIEDALPVITSPAVADGIRGAPFNYQITATGDPTSFAAYGLPPGLSINATTGIISGTPTQAGETLVNLGATGPGGTGFGIVTIRIIDVPAITSALAASGTVGEPFAYQISASFRPESFAAVGLPAGLWIDPVSGQIAGTPEQAGAFDVEISATNAAGTGSATLVLTIMRALPVITSELEVTATANEPFTYQIAATESPTHFSAWGLPDGLTLDSETGIISGRPLVSHPPETVLIPISASNESGPGPVATLALTVLRAQEPLSPPVITSELRATGMVGTPLSYQIVARNDPTSFSASGLPDGLQIDPDTGIISGTPTGSGNFRVTITATNAAGSGSATLMLQIQASVDQPCPTLPFAPNLSGPDSPGIQCWIPNDCCAPSPCVINEEDFICAIRSLLPEGDIYNNTLPPAKEPVTNVGAITVGCARVGCEQLVFGGCCDDTILCDDNPVAPQLAVVDAYAAVAYATIVALCQTLPELDPCRADKSLHRWGDRFGITHPDPCGAGWSDAVLAFLICIMLQIKLHVINWAYLTELAAQFGADVQLRYAGDLNGGPDGWWTMARDQTQCEEPVSCPEDPSFWAGGRIIRMAPECQGMPQSLNIVLCPTDRVFPDNCNLPLSAKTLPHDPEFYDAFKWLLPKILPQPVFWCIYECDPEDCIV